VTGRTPSVAAPPGVPPPTDRVLRRRRTLPGGRAVVGALLVAAAAIGVTGVVLRATAAPTTAFVVAGTTLEPGQRFETAEDVRAAFGRTTVDLPPTLAERAIPAERIDDLVGSVLVSPLDRGDLVVRSAFAEARDGDGRDVLSFLVPRSAAVGGALRSGDLVDVVATYGSGTAAVTDYVARGITVVAAVAPDAGVVGTSGDLTITLAVDDAAQVLALGHAFSTGDVLLVRSSGVVGDRTPGAVRDPSADPDGELADDGSTADADATTDDDGDAAEQADDDG
jgi:hypothetical protein